MQHQYHILEDYPDVLTFEELRQALNIGRNKCYSILRNQEIQHKKIGKLYRIPKNNVIEYLENQF